MKLIKPLLITLFMTSQFSQLNITMAYILTERLFRYQ